MDTDLTTLATRKFDFEDIVSADPLCPPSALKLIRSYLNFVTDFDVPVYRSIIDLMVATSLSNRHIIDTRKKLVKLKYYIPAGKTADGVPKFKLTLAANENRILDHQALYRDHLRVAEAERKIQQRTKRKISVSEDISRTQITYVREETSRTQVLVSEDSAGTDTLVPCGKFTDVSEDSSCNYLDEYLEGISSEEVIIPARETLAPPPIDDDPGLAALRRAAQFNGG